MVSPVHNSPIAYSPHCTGGSASYPEPSWGTDGHRIRKVSKPELSAICACLSAFKRTFGCEPNYLFILQTINERMSFLLFHYNFFFFSSIDSRSRNADFTTANRLRLGFGAGILLVALLFIADAFWNEKLLEN